MRELEYDHEGKPLRIGFEKLQRKVGSNSPEKKFRFFLRQIAEDGHIPDYEVYVDGDIVTFTILRHGFSRRQARQDQQGLLRRTGAGARQQQSDA